MFKIAFVGNPNVGKSALINAISESNLKVGNWSGVTVAKKEAFVNIDNKKLHLIDLPGIYNLEITNNEQKITFDFLTQEKIDLIVNVVDATNLERNLYLTMILRQLQLPMILVLNFTDELERINYSIDKELLAKYLQMKIVSVSAVKKQGIDQLKQLLISNVNSNFKIYYNNQIDHLYVDLYKHLLITNNKEYSLDKLAWALMEDNSFLVDLFTRDELFVIKNLINTWQLENKQELKSSLAIARYQYVKQIVDKVLKRSDLTRLSLTNKIDDIVLNKYLAIPIMFMGCFLLFNLIFKFTSPFMDFIDGFVGEFITKYINYLIAKAPIWIQSLIIDGIIGGVGGVLVFIPLMSMLFLVLALLEEVGYMARIAFLVDKLMKIIGLNGKAFICLLLGFGCTVPAIMATRTLENQKLRKITIMMLPFISCGARLPIYGLFAGAFFGVKMGMVIMIIYLIGLMVAIGVGIILTKNLAIDDQSAFIFELPPYRIPSINILIKKVWYEIKDYFKRAATIVLFVLVILWGLTYFPNQKIEDSYVAKTAKIIQPIFIPAGFGDRWEIVASIPGSIAAKEAVVGFLGQVVDNQNEDSTYESFSFNNLMTDLKLQATSLVAASKEAILNVVNFNQEIDNSNTSLIDSMQNIWGDDQLASLKAFSFMVFMLLVTPCVASLVTVKNELGKKALYQIIGLTLIIPYFVSIIVFQLGRMFI